MLSDVRWTGVGAGCFNALLPIYRDVDDAAANEAPTTAALIAIELGRPALWALIILALGAALYFFRAALLRGRDYVYSAVGSGCILAIVVLSFSNSGPIELATSLLASIILGLALAQSKSLNS
jgi:FtsH-binding integral membrane protein